MRSFTLERSVDHSGISGTGTVAEGVEFSDGTVALRWLKTGTDSAGLERGVKPTTVVHEDVQSVEALHGHNGATRVVWRDEP